MTTYHGKNGVAMIGAAAVAEVTGFTVTVNQAVADDTVQGDDWDTHLPGRKSWTAQINCRSYSGDTTGQAVLKEGDTPSLDLRPEGDTTGLMKLTGTATVTSVTIASNNDGVVEYSAQCTGNGTLTRGTVSA